MTTVFVIYSQTVKFRENGANVQLSMFLILALTERTEDFVPATEHLFATLRMAQEHFEKKTLLSFLENFFFNNVIFQT